MAMAKGALMENKKEDEYHTYGADGQIAMKPVKQTLRERLNLTDADLDWLASEVGKRLAKQMRTSGSTHMAKEGK